MSATPATATTAATATNTSATAPLGVDISTTLLLAFILGLIAMFSIIGIFSAKNMLGTYFNILYYIVFPVILYLISVGFNAISQRGSCNGITNIGSCFSGAGYTLGYLYTAMILVNLVGPNGIWTFEPDEMVRIKTVETLVPEKGLSALSPNVPERGSEIPIQTISPVSLPPQEETSRKRILRQKGGDLVKNTMSDGALMIRSFFTTLRAPAMSLFIRDPNAATLEDVETKSPIYTGIGIGFWACLATISGQVISSSIAQVCGGTS